MDYEKQQDEKDSDKNEAKVLCMDKEMIPCKLTAFLSEACFSPIYAFMSLFYISNGLTVAGFGLANGIGSVFALLSSPIMGGVIDSLTKYRILFFVVILFSTITSEVSKPWIVMLVAKTNESMTSHTNYTTRNEVLNPGTLLSVVIVHNVVSSVLFLGIYSYIESAISKTVFTRKKPRSYGKQRALGPIGCALGIFCAGVAVDHYHPEHSSPYLAAFYLSIPLTFMLLPFLYILSKQADWEYGREEQKKDEQISVKTHLVQTFKKLDNLIFLCSVFIAGLSLNVYFDYLFIYMDEVMKPSKTVMALNSVVSSISEFLIYPISSKLMKVLGGPLRCINLSILTTAFRCFVISYCTRPWHILIIQPLQGLGLSLAWAAMIDHIWVIVPPEITSTTMSLVCSVMWDLPCILSNIGGGYIYHIYGGPFLFRGVAIVSAIWCVFMGVFFELRNRGSYTLTSNKHENHIKGTFRYNRWH